jgi:two-component system, cell cycle sensor histidine kinase and response regulator CckA
MASQLKPRNLPWHLITIFLVMAIGIGVSGYLYYKNQTGQIKKAKEDELSAIATLKVGEISRWRNNRIEDGMLIFKNPLIVSRFHQWMGKQGDYKPKEEILAWMKLLQEHHSYYDSVIFLDTNGEPVLSVPNVDNVGTTPKKLAAEAMRKKEVMLSDIYRSSTNEIRMGLLVPLLVSKGHDTLTLGVLLLRIDPQRFLYPLIQSWPTPSRTAESLLVRIEGKDVLFLNELRHRKNTALALRFPLTNQQLPAAIVTQGKEGIIEGRDYRGVKVLAALRVIPDSPWFLIAKVDTEELYASVRVFSRLIFVLISVLIVFSGMAIVFFWQQHRKKAEEAIGKLHYQNELILKSAGEGIFGLDIQGKHTFVNPAAAQLLGYTVNELTGRHSHALWHYKKSDGSSYPVEDCPIYAAYKDGEVHHRDDEVFWRKDGTSFPVQYSSTPVMEDGEIVGAVVTFMDITERKRIEESLKLDEERLEGLLDLTQMEIKSEREITDFALEEGVRLTKSKGGYLHFFSEDKQTIQLYSWSKDVWKICTAEQDHHYPLEAAGVWADSIRIRRAVIHNDYQSLPNRKGYPEGHFHLVRHLGIPIFDGDHIVGVAGVGNKEESYNDSDVRQITLLMKSMWGILKQRRSEQEQGRLVAELQALSIKDELTGLYNRRGIFSMVAQHYTIARRLQKTLMLLFIDLDGMKQINDLYGHQEGDNALIDTANILIKTFRDTDIVARIGGDEFAIFGMIMEDRSFNNVTARINEKLDARMREHAQNSTKPYALSLSTGFAFADPQIPFSFDSMLSEADQNMYLWKKKKKDSEV